MLDWLTWPANLLLNTAAVIESWFVSKASVNFGLIQMALAVLLLTRLRLRPTRCIVVAGAEID